MTDGQRLADAAANFVGTPFKLHGRNPNIGLDCVGLVEMCLRFVGIEPSLPRGYRFRNSCVIKWLSCAEDSGLHLVDDHELPGDIGLFQPSPSQHHLMIVETPRTYIHAHAGLKKVVRETTPQPHMFSRKWRLTAGLQD